MFEKELNIIPDFPRTKHLPLEPNAQRDDLIATRDEAKIVFDNQDDALIVVEEKIDAANVGMTIHNDEPLIRNRNYILRKGYGRKNTPAKLQYAPIWTWFYSNIDKFKEAEKLFGFKPTIYGEWLYARHTIAYDLLSSYFMPFDVYNPEKRLYISPEIYRPILKEVGFNIVPFVLSSNLGITERKLLSERDRKSELSSTDRREGIYIKIAKDGQIVQRFKMVRPDFIAGKYWNNKGELTKNRIKK